MEGSANNWCTIESDPGVFTSLIESFGVKNAQLTELWSLDDSTLQSLVENYGKVYGLIFLFKWQRRPDGDDDGKAAGAGKPLVGGEAPSDLFFARQVTTNACATQAILSILLNAPTANDVNNNDIELGSTLSNLKEFTTGLPSDLKGESIGSCEEIRTAHNSFARKESFLMEEDRKRTASDDDDVFHFVAYVPHDGVEGGGGVFELDGLEPGPVRVGTAGGDGVKDMDWLSVARTAIQTRIENYASTEIKFNLMALVRDRRVHIRSQLDGNSDDGMVSRLHMELAQEDEMRRQWKEENERRRHNYVPFCVELIRALARSGKLGEVTEEARKRTEEMRKKAMMEKLGNMGK